MNEFDDTNTLHERLDARANSIAPEEDWNDLLERVGRRNRRTTRALAGALSIVVIAAAVGVVVAARGDQPASKSKPVASARDYVDATNAPVPTFNAVPTSGGYGASSSAGSAPLVANGQNKSSVSDAIALPPNVFSPGGTMIDMARVFTRTTANGIVIRAYRADFNVASQAHGPPWWTPPGYCFPNAYVQADVSTADIAGVGTGELYAEPSPGSTVGGQLTVIGVNEQSPRVVVLAQGPASTAQLRATFANGAQDEMTPVGGFAVLVGPAPSDLTKDNVKIEAFDTSGASLGTTTLSASNGLAPLRATSSACNAPTALPAAGAQQPTDVAAARAAVIDAFNAVNTHGISDSQFDSYFEDSHGFEQVRKQLRAGPFVQQVNTATEKVDGVVFLDATTAAIQYEIDVPNYGTPSFPNRFTEAHLVNGSWKFTRAGYCSDVALAGVTCPS